MSKWLTFLLPDFQNIEDYSTASGKCYHLLDGGGQPLIYTRISNAIQDINEIQRINALGAYDYLIVMIDSESISPSQREQKIYDKLHQDNVKLNEHCIMCIISQNVCIETWLLGNRKMFSRNSQNPAFLDLVRHFNVMIDDPEQMPNLDEDLTLAQFHYKYLKIMLREKRISYSKGSCEEVTKSKYFDNLSDRFISTNHIPSFGEFLNLINEIKNQS